MSIKNSNDTIGNRSSDLPVCSTVPQPTTPPTQTATELYIYQVEEISENRRRTQAAI
jgi:hypothetical protein